MHRSSRPWSLWGLHDHLDLLLQVVVFRPLDRDGQHAEAPSEVLSRDGYGAVRLVPSVLQVFVVLRGPHRAIPGKGLSHRQVALEVSENPDEGLHTAPSPRQPVGQLLVGDVVTEALGEKVLGLRHALGDAVVARGGRGCGDDVLPEDHVTVTWDGVVVGVCRRRVLMVVDVPEGLLSCRSFPLALAFRVVRWVGLRQVNLNHFQDCAEAWHEVPEGG